MHFVISGVTTDRIILRHRTEKLIQEIKWKEKKEISKDVLPR